MSSAKSRSSRRDVSVHCMPVGLLYAVLLTQSITRRNRSGESRQPCLTPVDTENGAVTVPPWITWHVSPSYSCMMDIILYSIQSTWWSTLSNAFWKFLKFSYSDVCHSIVCSIILRWLSGQHRNSLVWSLLACLSSIYPLISSSSTVWCCTILCWGSVTA